MLKRFSVGFEFRRWAHGIRGTDSRSTGGSQMRHSLHLASLKGFVDGHNCFREVFSGMEGYLYP